jgi:hypothetical protein
MNGWKLANDKHRERKTPNTAGEDRRSVDNKFKKCGTLSSQS